MAAPAGLKQLGYSMK